MGVKVNGAEQVERMFSNLDANAKRRLRRAMVRKGREVQRLAQKFAPREYGNLEEAIKMAGDTGAEQIRDEMGRMGRIQVEVYIDDKMPIPERPGKTVGDYAYHIHEHLTPMGPMQLGDDSVAKQQGQAEVVGGGYLTRAAEQVEATMDAALLEILNTLEFG